MSDETAQNETPQNEAPVRPADLPSDSDIDLALNAMNAEYEEALVFFLEGFKNRDFITVLMSADFFAELLAKINLINGAIPFIEDEAVKAKAEAAVIRFEEMLKELENAAKSETEAMDSENPGSDDDHGVFVIDL